MPGPPSDFAIKCSMLHAAEEFGFAWKSIGKWHSQHRSPSRARSRSIVLIFAGPDIPATYAVEIDEKFSRHGVNP